MFRVVIDLRSAGHLIDRPRQSISFQDIELAKTISLGSRYKSALLDTSSIPTACDLYLIKLIGGGVTATGRITNIFSNASISSEYKKWRQQWRRTTRLSDTHTPPATKTTSICTTTSNMIASAKLNVHTLVDVFAASQQADSTTKENFPTHRNKALMEECDLILECKVSYLIRQKLSF